MKALIINIKINRMKPTCFLYSIIVLFLSFGMVSCNTEENLVPSIKGYLNGSEVKQIMVAKGDTVNYKYKIKASSNLTKVELYVRSGIGLNTESRLVLQKTAEAGDLIGDTCTIEGSLVDSTDLMIYVNALDSEGKFTFLQLNALMDISEFNDLSMMDAMEDGTSASFCDSQYGLTLYAANTAADPSAIDFGFIYMESNVNVRACLVSFSDFGKTCSYPIVGSNNVTVFKRASEYNAQTNATQLKQSFDSGTDFSSVLGITAGEAAVNLNAGDVIAFKTHLGKYGNILIKSIDRKGEASGNQQTITFNMIVQK